MRKLITLFIVLSLICTGSIQAQSLLKVDDFTVINNKANNVTVQVTVAEQAQAVSSHLAEFKNGQKAGFTPTLNADNTQLTLNFTRQFSEDELTKLLKYTEIELSPTAFNELYNLINQ